MKRVVLLIGVFLYGVMVAVQAKAAQVEQPLSAVSELRVAKVTAKSARLKWKASKNASGYIVFQYNKKARKFKKIKITKKKSCTVKKGLDKNKAAKFMVQAYQKKGTVKKFAPCSEVVSAYVQGSKKKNVKAIDFMYSLLTVEEGATFSLNANVMPKKNVASKKICFMSSNPNVIQVLANGVMVAKKRGKVTITARAHNGVSSKIKVWVLERQDIPEVHKISAVEDIQVTAKDRDSLKIEWKKCRYTDGYIVYQYNNATKKYNKIKMIKGKKKTSVVISGLKQDVNYSFMVKGYRQRKGFRVYGGDSRIVSGCVLDGNYANASSIRFGKTEYEVMEEAHLKLDCILEPKNVISQAVTYKSSKEEIATVTSDGTVIGHKVGKTYITAYSHNGLSVRVPVYVVENETDRIPVCCFHRVVSDSLKKNKFKDNRWVAAVSDFEKQMKYLYDNHYNTLTVDEFYEWHQGKREMPRNTVVLTFDDGDYEFYHIVYPILKKYKLKATMFIIGSFVGKTTEEYKDTETIYYLGWDKINEMKKEYPNISFQSHTYNMHYAHKKLAVYELKLPQIYEDFETNLSKGIENKNPYQYLAYPYGGFNDDVVYCAKKYKYKMAFDFGPGRLATRDDSVYHIPRTKIDGQCTMKEFMERISVPVRG